jgi:hypothetical protein
MKQTELPAGWNEEKVQRVLAHYDGQTDDEAVAEDRAGVEGSATVVEVPHDLLPQVRELIAKRRR